MRRIQATAQSLMHNSAFFKLIESQMVFVRNLKGFRDVGHFVQTLQHTKVLCISEYLEPCGSIAKYDSAPSATKLYGVDNSPRSALTIS